MLRIVVAEDSPTARELMVAILESDPELRVVGQARHGAEAVDLAARLLPDLVTMDVHMPVLDGIEATRQIMTRSPTPILLVSSSTSAEDVHMSLDAMQAGALMIVAKPDDPKSPGFDRCRSEFLAMVKAMARVKVVRRWANPVPSETRAVRLPAPAGHAVRLVAIVASTGGPAALLSILRPLPGDFSVPILVVQHIAVGFMAGLANWLDQTCRLGVKLAESDELLRPGTVYVAPDARQMGASPGGSVVLADTPPVGGFRPSGSYLFESAARAYGASLVAVVLTGMGNDGVAGLAAVKAAGGRVLAQDQSSSVVFGMPQEAIATGVVDAVLGLDEIAPWLVDLTAGGMRVDAHSRR